MSVNQEIYSLFPWSIVLPGPAAGASFPVTRFDPLPGQQSVALKIVTGGTCRLVAIGGVSTPLGVTVVNGVTTLLNGITTGFGATLGFLIESGTPLSLNMRGPMFFQSSGSTCVIEMVIGRTKGDYV